MGSSPLTRGKRGFAGLTGPIGRLIPAHAGKTRDSGWRELPDGAHPRSRGENALDSRRWSWEKGSSPLTRGKRSSGCTSPGEHRLIPAHAGKTSAVTGRYVTATAHPRSRGENTITRETPVVFCGSSPLTRGKRGTQMNPLTPIRLIPAHAGKTSNAAFGGAGCSAHPRSRGENRSTMSAPRGIVGSSPLTRGKQSRRLRARRRRRLIPAHAGKTTTGISRSNEDTAHPRSRGENGGVLLEGCQDSGSSPLTRGKPKNQNSSQFLSRLIPAHAGKTLIL